MASFSRDYKGSKAPGAAFAILMTLAVNVALFAVLGWVNRRDVVREPDDRMMTTRLTYSLPKPPKTRKTIRKNRKKPVPNKEAKRTVSRTPKPKPTRPKPRRSLPTMPSIRMSMPSMTLNLQGNLALPTHVDDADDGIVPDTSTTGDQVADNEGVDQPARVIYQARPKYPLSAKRMGRTGTVGVEVIASTSGLPTKARVVRSSGHRSLDRSALHAISLWRFSPAVDGGEKVPVRCTINFTFELDQ